MLDATAPNLDPGLHPGDSPGSNPVRGYTMVTGFASLVGALAVLWLALGAGTAGAGELRVVAFGDSLTAGFGRHAICVSTAHCFNRCFEIVS